MIGVLGVLQIDLNARVLAVLLILEVVIVALFDFAILADPGPEGIDDDRASTRASRSAPRSARR